MTTLFKPRGGLMSITGVPDGEPGAGPQRVGMAAAGLTTGMNSAISILAALYHRQKTGEGQYIDMALLDVQVSWLANQAQNYFCSAKAPTRSGEYHPNLAPYQPFPTRDGELIIAVSNDGQFRRLCDALDLAPLATDSRFATNPARVENRPLLAEQLKTATRKRSSREWMETLREIKVPCGPVQSIDEVFTDPQVLARDMVVEVDHPQLGPVPTVANPIKYSLTPVEYGRAPPLLGEDTHSLLSGLLNYSDEDIETLRRNGVI